MHLLAWLTFYRPHTASFHISLVLIGFLMAGGELLSTNFWIWALVGFFYHIFGFGHNNLADYTYDLNDENKKHFPLVTGEVQYRDAVTFTMAGVALTATVIGYMTGSIVGILLVFVTVTSGFVYNHFSKSWSKSIFLAPVAKTPLLLIAYLSVAGELSWTVLFYTSFVYWILLYSYLIGGAGKDIESDRVNFLKDMGARVIDREGQRWYYPGNTGVLIGAVGFAAFISLAAVEWGLNFPVSTGLLLLSLVFAINYRWLWLGKYDRVKAHRRFFIGYLLTNWSAVVAITPMLSWLSTAILAGYFPVWLLLWNRLLWGSWLRPNV